MYRLVAGTNVDQHWASVAPMIAKAIGGNFIEEELLIVKHKAEQGVAQIWIGSHPETDVVDFVMVTEGMVLDNIPTLVIRWLTADDFQACSVDLALLENWALHQGYRRLQAWGRPGWQYKLKPLGFHHSFTVMDKFIEKGLH